jgi:hypothetical protein
MAAFQMHRLTDAPLHASLITFDGKTWQSRKNHRKGGLVTFRGVYPSGSAGSDDARYMRWLLSEFYRLHRPDGLVVDCRALEYSWGDDFGFQDREPYKADSFALLVVLRPDQQLGYDYVVPRVVQRLSLEAALAEVDEDIRSMSSIL